MQETAIIKAGKAKNQIAYDYGHGLMTRKTEEYALSREGIGIYDGLAGLADNLARLGFDMIKIEKLQRDGYSPMSNSEKVFLAKTTHHLFKLYCEEYEQIRKKMICDSKPN